MDLGIAGKTAVVTGGSRGLGFASAEALAREGVNIVLFARDQGRLDDARARLERHGVSVDTVAGEMASREDVGRLAEVAGGRGTEILVLNTGRPPSPMRDFLDETDDDRLEDGYRTQLLGGMYVLQAIAPLMIAKGWGRVVAITSASIKQPLPHHAVSTIYRAGLAAALRHLANETVDKGVTVNSICPASVVTESFSKNFNLEARLKTIPMGRFGTEDELANTVAFFASQHSGFMTGVSVQMDGGMTGALY